MSDTGFLGYHGDHGTIGCYHGGLKTGARFNKLQKRNVSGPEGTLCSTRWLPRTELLWREGDYMLAGHCCEASEILGQMADDFLAVTMT